jgi:hypothetical protein
MKTSPIAVLIAFLGLVSSPATSQENSTPRFEAYALASNWGSGAGTSSSGFRLGGAWRPQPRFCLVADVSHHFNSDDHSRLTALMAGPRFYSHERFRMSGFAQLLLGSQRLSFSGAAGQTAWNFIVAPGAGFDVRLTNHLALRPLELELTLNRGSGLLRASSGFAFKFGK